MKKLIKKYRSHTRTEIDYAQILEDTNIYGKGKHLKPNSDAKKEIVTFLNEIEAKHDFEAALRLLTNGELMTPERMNVCCELEYQMFFRPGKFKHALYIGSGGYPLIATYVLERDRHVKFDCLDIVPYATVICERVVKELGFSDRVHAFTGNVLEFTKSDTGKYDAYFLSSAVRPKNAIIRKLLEIKNENAKIYAREDVSHPDFYEPVEVEHPDLLSAPEAYVKWEQFISAKGGAASSTYSADPPTAAAGNLPRSNIKMDGTRMEAAIVFESFLPNALRRALEYASDDGFVASMPQLLHARVNAPYDNIIWNTWFTANSEESVATTPRGHRVVVAVHGGGIYASPERFEKAYRSNSCRLSPEGLTGQYAGKISKREVEDLLDGKLPDGTEIPVFSFDEFKRGVPDLPLRYGVIMDFEMAGKSTRGYDSFDVLKDEPNMIVRAGGVEPLAVYLDKARNRHNTAVMGNWHPYNRIDPDQAQTRITFLAGNLGGVGTEDNDDHLFGYDSEYGIGGDACMHNMARYVAVAPRNVSASLRYLPFGA